jgi:hypothetical protein
LLAFAALAAFVLLALAFVEREVECDPEELSPLSPVAGNEITNARRHATMIFFMGVTSAV